MAVRTVRIVPICWSPGGGAVSPATPAERTLHRERRIITLDYRHATSASSVHRLSAAHSAVTGAVEFRSIRRAGPTERPAGPARPPRGPRWLLDFQEPSLSQLAVRRVAERASRSASRRLRSWSVAVGAAIADYVLCPAGR